MVCNCYTWRNKETAVGSHHNAHSCNFNRNSPRTEEASTEMRYDWFWTRFISWLTLLSFPKTKVRIFFFNVLTFRLQAVIQLYNFSINLMTRSAPFPGWKSYVTILWILNRLGEWGWIYCRLFFIHKGSKLYTQTLIWDYTPTKVSWGINKLLASF